MTLSDIEAIRLRSSDKSTITHQREIGNGSDSIFKLDQSPILISPVPQVRKNATLLTEGPDYTVDYAYGYVTFAVVPAANDELDFAYYWSIFTDVEIQYFLDAEGGDTTRATASLLLAWAADAAKVAKRQTLSGGGGLGQVVLDTSVIAKELRATAKALIDQAIQVDATTPAEGYTQIPWTEAMFRRTQEQSLLDDN